MGLIVIKKKKKEKKKARSNEMTHDSRMPRVARYFRSDSLNPPQNSRFNLSSANSSRLYSTPTTFDHARSTATRCIAYSRRGFRLLQLRNSRLLNIIGRRML